MIPSDWQPGFSITGIKVGHAQNSEALTGCTAIICEKGATSGVDQRGGAPGTRETDALRPMHMVEHCHAVVLSGGSAFGLDAATGVVRYLEEKHIGFDTGVAHVPIVASAVLFDLAIGNPKTRPDSAMGYQACISAKEGSCSEGNIGAGTGATVGKILGMECATKAGIGAATIYLSNQITISAIIALNAFGHILDPDLGGIIAGARFPGTRDNQQKEAVFADTIDVMRSYIKPGSQSFKNSTNTVIGVVATNAILTKEGANKVAQMAHDGIARTVRPAHTMFDGDTLFTMATNEHPADLNIIGVFAAEAVSRAIVRAVECAKSSGGIPSASDLHTI
jgi:L-aminopeptidase/D-esterase-like protein